MKKLFSTPKPLSLELQLYELEWKVRVIGPGKDNFRLKILEKTRKEYEEIQNKGK